MAVAAVSVLEDEVVVGCMCQIERQSIRSERRPFMSRPRDPATAISIYVTSRARSFSILPAYIHART